jgi:protein-disulfide isomerase
MSNEPSKQATPSEGGVTTGVAIVGFILCFLAGIGLMWGYDQHRRGTVADKWSDEDSPVPVTSDDPMWGSRNALVTIVEFSDLQCPYCSRVGPTIEQIKSTYTAEKVRIIWKNEPLPFHPNARPAAEAGQGVFMMKGSTAFWKFNETAFRNQGTLSTENYEKWAREAGVTDIEKFKAGLSAHTWADKVDKDHAVAKQAGVNGTPAFTINGILISGAQPFEKFKAIIDEEMRKAEAKVASGTARDRVYVVMSQENRKAAPPPPKEEEGDKEDTKTVFKVPLGTSPMKGAPTALVTIVEFSDFQCGFCARVEDTLKKVTDTYGDKVRLVWKHEPLPFHPRAEPAAQLSMEARAQKGDKGFWDVHDRLFAGQSKLEDPDLEKAAQEAGLNVDKVKDAIKNHKFKKDIDADLDLAEDLQASGTPNFFINGRHLVGAQPFEKFQKIIDEEIIKTTELLAKGIKPAALYETLIKDGKGPPEPEKKMIAALATAPSRGPANAKVIIQQFSDFQCPFCERVEPTIAEILKNYGDKVKLQWRNMPLSMHPDAPLAAQAAMEVFKQKGADAFWKMHHKIFENQKTPDGLKREKLDGYAKEFGCDMDKWKVALDTQAHKAEVDADLKAANEAGIQGAPAFLIGNTSGGYFVNGAQSYAKFRRLIERALAESK